MLGSIIGAGASILGGILGNRSAKKQAEQQYQHQKEFAQSGIQWKVADAEKAGIHPLYALGAQTTSYQPTSVGGTDFGLPEAGQNIGRAINATRSSPEQRAAIALTSAQIEGVQLDNDLKRAQLASSLALATQNGQVGIPAIGDVNFVDGQGDSGVITSVPPGHKASPPQYTSPDLMVYGHRWERLPGSSDAQAWEDVYGDESLLPFILNNYRGYRDALYNTSRMYRRNVIDKLRR